MNIPPFAKQLRELLWSGKNRNAVNLTANVTLVQDDFLTLVTLANTPNPATTIYLPDDPQDGQTVLILATGTNQDGTLNGNGKSVVASDLLTAVATVARNTASMFEFVGALDTWVLLQIASAATATAPGGSDTNVQYNDAGAFGGDAGFVYDKTNKVATISGGTPTTNKPVLSLSQTWNTLATTFKGFVLNITATSKAIASSLFSFELAGSPVFWADFSEGNGRLAYFFKASIADAQKLTIIPRDTLTTRATTNPAIISNGTLLLAGGANGLDRIFLFGASVQLGNPTTVGNLPTAAQAGNGARAYVTDATLAPFAGNAGAPLVGGGANGTPAIVVGGTWVIEL